MMFPSHLLATVLLGLALTRVRPWDAKAWVLALAFGVFIDLDHLLQIPRYVAEHGGVAALADAGRASAWGANWQGFMHTPWGALVAAAGALAFASYVPVVAWGLHMVLDFVVATRWVRFGSPMEYALDALLLAVALSVLWADRAAWGRATGAATAVLAALRK